MKTEQRIIALGAILASFLSYIHSNDEDCPTSPCCENKPKLGPNDKLEIGMFYEEYEEGDEKGAKLVNNICKLTETCGDQISLKAIPGGLVEEKNGEISCPYNFCYGDQVQICSIMIDPEYESTCKGIPPEDAIKECLDTKIDEVNQILIENGKKRENMGIPKCRLFPLTFNGVLDLCADVSSYDNLLNYVCEMYENQLCCCNN